MQLTLKPPGCCGRKKCMAILIIAVDVHDDSGVTKPMNEVLDSVISSVNKQYKLNLEWKVIDGVVVIKKVNGSTVLSDNSATVN